MTQVDNSVLAILKRAKQRLIDKGWTQEFYAREAIDGDYCNSWSPKAVCFCGHGAVYADAPVWNTTPNHHKAVKRLDEVVGEEFDEHFPTFNDTPGRTVEEVLAKYDEAIAAQEAFPPETIT